MTALAAAARQKPVGGGGQLTEWLKLSGARQYATTGDGYTKADRNTERKKMFLNEFPQMLASTLLKLLFDTVKMKQGCLKYE